MAKIFKFRFILLVSILILCVVQSSFAAKSDSLELVSAKLLEHANLKMLWGDRRLPIKKEETLEQLFVLGSRLYAITNRNYMISLNRTNGDMIFGRVVTQAGLPVTGLNLYGDKLISISGSNLLEIDPDSGKTLKTLDVGYGIVCPAVRNSSYFYISGIDKRLHTLRAKDKVQIFEVAAGNNSIITSVLAHEISVIFATDAGNVISISPDSPKRLWQFDAADSIMGSVVRDGFSLFFASKDTNVYRIDMVGLPENTRLIWKYQAAGILDRAPHVTQTVVYQYVPNKGLAAIDRENGALLWLVPGGVDLLTEARGKAYVITKDKMLVVMDNFNMKKLYSANFSEVSRYATNTVDSKIYIADEQGRIACLQPLE